MTAAIAQNGPAAAKAAGPSATPASPLSSAMAKHRQELGTLATTLPFFAYTACFLLAPTVIVIVGAFQDRSGNFTLANFNKMFEANTIAAFGTSILVSVASSVIGAVVGALASYALVIGAKPNGLLRRMISAISSVLAQFGGVMLAFAFIATIGINGIGTMLIKTLTGYTVNPNWLSSLPGLITIYCYFQIPLMIIIFLPAVDSIRPQWREACESLGGNTFQYWTRVACPILAPRFISAFLLLFASAFSAYATAAALFSQRSILVPLIPAIIMISTTIANIWLVKDTPAWEVVNFIGSSPIAMFIAMVVAFVLFGTARGHDMQWVMNAFESAVKSIAMVILIIGAGGVLKQTIIDTGIGDTIGMLMSHGNISPYIMAWLITVLIRLATGQGVVSAMTAAGIISAAILDPATGQLVGVNPALLVLATAAGSNTLTHINDASFWLFKGYFDLSVKDTLKTWGLLELVNSVVGLIIVLIISMVA